MIKTLPLLLRILFVFLLFGGMPSIGFSQQKPQFTQYMFNILAINPAYAGAEDALSITFIDRHQWLGVENAPTTQTLSAHSLVRKKHIGLGLSIFNDKIGVYTDLKAITNYAYHVRIGNDSYLSMGIQAGIHNNRANYSSLQGSSLDPRLVNSINETYFDFGFGIYLRSPRFHIGISAPEFIPKKISLNDTLKIQLGSTNYFLFSKYRFPISENWDLEPSTLLKYLPGIPVSYDLNLNLIYRKVLTTGLSYRGSESLDFLLRAQVTRQLQFGYAYDYPISTSSKLSNGSHEIMVNYVFKYMRKNIDSPR
jgi:type IX secretion system PorP/SprF family membrane protein